MGKLRSFRDVIQDYFYNEIFGELSAYIEDNPSKELSPIPQTEASGERT